MMNGRSCDPTNVASSFRSPEKALGAGYLRTNGEIERDNGEIGFASLTIVRPGLFGGARSGWPKT